MTELNKLPELNEIWQQSLGWQPQPPQQVKFTQLYREIILANRQLNLTRITEPMEFWEKHLWDSLAGVIGLDLREDLSQSVIDIGTGAGFPGVPLAIAFPNWQITLLDSVQKKMSFLQELITQMELKNTTILVDRVEKIGQNKPHRESYNLALIRAVAACSVCAEYALPLLKIGGIGVLYRGQYSEQESLNLESAVTKLGGKIETVKQFKTPLTYSMRHCIYIRKIAATPKKFPRGVGIAVQKPL